LDFSQAPCYLVPIATVYLTFITRAILGGQGTTSLTELTIVLMLFVD